MFREGCCTHYLHAKPGITIVAVMPRFESFNFRLGQRDFGGVRAARPLTDSRVITDLARQFRKSLLEMPLHFRVVVRLTGFPMMQIEWVSLCKTAGIILLRSGGPELDAVCLLLNGVETEDEIALIRQHTPELREHWKEIVKGPRPLTVNGHFSPTRMSDSSLITAIDTFAIAYFGQFGSGDDLE
jgi:hypothetical protein